MKLNGRSRLFVLLCVIGILDAIYHGYDELTASFSTCNINAVYSCQSVFNSGYTSVLGIQFWVFGVVWFPLCLLVGLLVIKYDGVPSPSIMLPFLMIGNLFTLYPWYLEIVIIKAYCPVCISLYAINYLLTVVAALSRR